MPIVDDRIENETKVPAGPETVFDYFTDPELIVRWQGRAARLEPRQGGEYTVELNDRSTSAGHFSLVERPDRIVFSWGWVGDEDFPPGSSIVEVTLTSDGNGTLVQVVHHNVPEGQRESHDDGWRRYLVRLAPAVAGEDPGPDPFP